MARRPPPTQLEFYQSQAPSFKAHGLLQDGGFRPSPEDLALNVYLMTHPEIDLPRWFEEWVDSSEPC